LPEADAPVSISWLDGRRRVAEAGSEGEEGARGMVEISRASPRDDGRGGWAVVVGVWSAGWRER